MVLSRRRLLSTGSITLLVPGLVSTQAPSPAVTLAASFPSHEPDLVREMVAVSHGNVARVRELLAKRPALAKASWDWGYGDWESALGAASHVGNREIASLLLDAGAAPTIFSAAMLGHLDVVKTLVAVSAGVQKTRGPHGLSLLAHARAGGAPSAAVVAYLESLGDADPRYANEPLPAGDRAALAGRYAFGPAPADRFIVTVEDRGPAIQREGAVPRNLFHLGGRVFHPVGAEAVRIRFAGGEPSASVTVEDGPIVVTATRVV